MKRMASVIKSVTTLVALSWLLAPVAALAQTSSNSPRIAIPTLDGAGLASLAGVLSIGGAWLLSKRRPRK